jgi:hypothetical protein
LVDLVELRKFLGLPSTTSLVKNEKHLRWAWVCASPCEVVVRKKLVDLVELRKFLGLPPITLG